MSILVGQDTRLVVQGITGREGEFHARQMVDYGTAVVAGVTPNKGGQTAVDGRVPVFDTVAEAVARTGANTSCIYVPAAGAPDAVLEAVGAGIGTVFCITEGIPALDMLKVVEVVRTAGARLIGPNCPGATSPGRAKVGIIPGSVHREGRVGVVSRSGTLTYEAVQAMTDAGIGQSTCVGIGGDPIIGTTFLDVLKLFAADPETDAIVLIGEIGGSAEEEAAAWAADRLRGVPMAAFIAGRTAPEGKRMGHAGAIISGGSGTAADKISALEAAGIRVADSPTEIPAILRAAGYGNGAG
jgi:succinyl-CoA synthetase alpha subunit